MLNIIIGGSYTKSFSVVRHHIRWSIDFYNVYIVAIACGVPLVAVTWSWGVDASTCWLRCEPRMERTAVWTRPIHISADQCGLNAHLVNPVSNQFESSLQCEHTLLILPVKMQCGGKDVVYMRWRIQHTLHMATIKVTYLSFGFTTANCVTISWFLEQKCMLEISVYCDLFAGVHYSITCTIIIKVIINLLCWQELNNGVIM